jgi:erythromycin esterase-like protein
MRTRTHGEPRLEGATHGEALLLDVCNELFRQLIEQEGYRTGAIESDCMMGLVVDDYVTSGTGTLDEVMGRGCSHGFGASAANASLCAGCAPTTTAGPPPSGCGFAGVDGPLEITGAASPRQALTALHAYLTAWADADLLPCATDTLDRLLGADDRAWVSSRTLPSSLRGENSRRD